MRSNLVFGRGADLERHGPGPSGYMRTIGKYMMQSGASFGFFMGIGTVIRSEGQSSTLRGAIRASPPTVIVLDSRLE